MVSHDTYPLTILQPRKHIPLENPQDSRRRAYAQCRVRAEDRHPLDAPAPESNSLFASRRYIAPEMIHATDESIVASLIEVLTGNVSSRRLEPSVLLMMTKRTGQPSDHRIVELLPVDFALIMGDINAMNLVALRIHLHRHRGHAT